MRKLWEFFNYPIVQIVICAASGIILWAKGAFRRNPNDSYLYSKDPVSVDTLDTVIVVDEVLDGPDEM